MKCNHNIDFNTIDDKQFEELCFEILWELGFKDLVWRGGPNDQGRDIECKYKISYDLIGEINEVWHFECKKYSANINQNVLVDKLNWADANSPDKLFFLISSQLTNQARIWLDKIALTKPYKIIIIEGIELKNKLQDLPHLITKYFGNGAYGLLNDFMKLWLIHDTFPSTGTLANFLLTLDMKLLSDEELIYLLITSLFVQHRIFENDEGVNNFDFNFIMTEFFKRVKGKKKSIILKNADIFIIDEINGSFSVNTKDYDYYIVDTYIDESRALYCIIGENGSWWELSKDEIIGDKGYEIIIFPNSNFTSKMRAISKDAYKYYKRIIQKAI